MSDRANTYEFFDSTIQIRTVKPNDREIYHAVFECLGRAGFKIRRRNDVGRCIRMNHHHAQKGNLQARLEICQAYINVEFYQNVVHINQYGGQYDFDKVDKMPYLIRLQFQATRKRLADMLNARGFVDITEVYPEDQFEYAVRRKLGACPSREQDRDGKILANGQFKYGRTYEGHLFQGYIYWDGGNMWNVVANSKVRHRCASFELFDPSPSEPRKRSRYRASRLDKMLKKAVDTQDFEKAIILRDIIKAEARP